MRLNIISAEYAHKIELSSGGKIPFHRLSVGWRPQLLCDTASRPTAPNPSPPATYTRERSGGEQLTEELAEIRDCEAMLEERIKEWEFDPGRGFKRAAPAMPSMIHKRSFDGSAAGSEAPAAGGTMGWRLAPRSGEVTL